MTTQVDALIKHLITEYLRGIEGILRDLKYTAEHADLVEPLQKMQQNLAAMADCFEGVRVSDERRMVAVTRNLGNYIMHTKLLSGLAAGDNVLRLTLYTLNAISNPWARPISERVESAHNEVLVSIEAIQTGLLDTVLEHLNTILENTGGLTSTGTPVKDIGQQIMDAIAPHSRVLSSTLGTQLIRLYELAQKSSGGVTNPFTREVRALSSNYGFEMVTIMRFQNENAALARADDILNGMRACFVNGKPNNLIALLEFAARLDKLVCEDDDFRQSYIGFELFGIASYLLRNIEQKRAPVTEQAA